MSSINFVLEEFNSEITLDLSGAMTSVLAPTLDVSASAIIYVPQSVLKETFKFQTDAVDLTNDAIDDLKYFVHKDTYLASVDLSRNPADAMLDASGVQHLLDDGAGNTSIGQTTSQGTPYALNKMFVCHDFVRYLAKKLFNTHFGVDLFNNEAELLQNIRYKCSSLDPSGTLTNIVNVLTAADVSNNELDGSLNGLNYMTDATNDNTNLTRVLMQQMKHTQAGRARFATDISGTDLPQGLPFRIGDSISFKLTINPAADQHLLTDVTAFGGRSYEIKYVLVGDAEATRVNEAVAQGELPVAAPPQE
jgi:hypothetical protein